MVSEGSVQEFRVQGGGCNAVLDDTAQQTYRQPCPHCGSSLSHIIGSVPEELQINEQVGMNAKDPTRPGKQKIRIERLIGDNLHRKSGKWHKKVKVINRENDRHFDDVVDPDTGEVIHRCKEPLSEHYQHGSA